jgi:hypothetical protein
MATIASVRSNPIICRFYRRLRQRGKPAKVALCACARKLILIAWAVVAKRQLFDPKLKNSPSWRFAQLDI